jgi:apolipoprotein N-acyltransferase
VAGVYGIGFLVAVSGVALFCLAHLVYARLQRGGSDSEHRPDGDNRYSGTLWPLLTIVVVALVWLASPLVDRIEWTVTSAEPIDVVVVQGNIDQGDKWRAAFMKPTLDRYFTLTRANADADLVVWPETAIPGLMTSMQPVIDELRAWSESTQTTVVSGIPRRAAASATAGGYFNSVVAVSGQNPVAVYDKRHLVPFGEYLPFRGLLKPMARILGLPTPAFIAGPDEQPPFEVGGHAFFVSICYEIAFGRDIRPQAREGAFLVNVSNDAWFGDTRAPHQHLEMARMRARELARPLVRSTNTGISAVVDTQGRVVSRLPQFELAVLRATIQARSGDTPYARLGNIPTLAVSALVIGLAGLGWRRREPIS